MSFQISPIYGCSVHNRYGKFPDIYLDDLNISANNIFSLEYCPVEIRGSFRCNNNLLTSLHGGPKKVHGIYECLENPIFTLQGFPNYVGDDLILCDNNLPFLHNIHEYTKYVGGSIILYNTNINSHVLGLFLIEGLKNIRGEGKWVNIVNKYITRGKRGMLACQKELIEAGLKEYAQL